MFTQVLELAGFGPATFCSPPQNKSFAGTPKYNQQVPTVTNCSLVQKKYHARGIVFFFGASGRIRTGDLLITKQKRAENATGKGQRKAV